MGPTTLPKSSNFGDFRLQIRQVADLIFWNRRKSLILKSMTVASGIRKAMREPTEVKEGYPLENQSLDIGKNRLLSSH